MGHLIVGVVALIGFLLYRQFFRKKAGPGLPPGPKTLPIIGNIKDLPPKGVPEYQHWLTFKDAYGPISSITALGQTIIIIHDREAAHELLEKRSTKTSGRPRLPFANDLCGFQKLLVSAQNNDFFRLSRKLVHQYMGTAANAAKSNDIQDTESRRFLLRVLQTPEDLVKHVKTEASAMILKMTYGYSIEPHKADPLVGLIDQFMNNFSLAFAAGTWLVDIFPALRYLPEFFPGAEFKKIAREYRSVNYATANVPYSFVRQRMANDAERPSFVCSAVQKYTQDSTEKGKLSSYHEEAIKWTAGSMYAGGADTTVSTLSAFVLAMLLFPGVQQKAQEELDRVIGTDRLPRFEDRDDLPYVSALVKEALRWFPVTPIGPAHSADEEIIYGEYRIPKGAYLLPSIWWFLHDPQTYPDPSTFDPERFLEPRNEPDPTTEVFGYGRRICPGRYFAGESLFITITRMLAVFNISKAVDEQGREIEAKLEYSSGLISHPAEFPYSIKPRSEKHAELIQSVEKDQPWEKADAGFLGGVGQTEV